MSKQRIHYVKVKVTFDKPVGRNKAVKEIRDHLATGDDYYTAPDLCDGAETFKVGSVVAAR
jgi:hypothetical protein